MDNLLHAFEGRDVLLIMFSVLIGLLTYLQTYIDNFHKIKDYELQTLSEADFEHTEQLIRQMGFKATVVNQRYNKESLNTTWRLTGNINQHKELVKVLRKDKQIVAYQY